MFFATLYMKITVHSDRWKCYAEGAASPHVSGHNNH